MQNMTALLSAVALFLFSCVGQAGPEDEVLQTVHGVVMDSRKALVPKA